MTTNHAQSRPLQGDAEATLRALDNLLGDMRPAPFAIRLWNCHTWTADDHVPPQFTLTLNHAGALRAMLCPPGTRSVIDAFLTGDFDVDGDLEAALALVLTVQWRHRFLQGRLHLGNALRTLPQATIGRATTDRLAGMSSVPDVFFALWLDRTMATTPANFVPEDTDLARAQERSFDALARTLRLQPGQRLLDLNCGWGAFAVHAATRYQVDVVGLAETPDQAATARRRLDVAGCGDRGTFIVDPAELAGLGTFDAVVNLGLLRVRHDGNVIGPDRLSELVTPGGVALSHQLQHAGGDQRDAALELLRAIGNIAPPGSTVGAARQAGFEVRAVRTRRESTVRTLRAWQANLDARSAFAEHVVPESTIRRWRLALAAASQAIGSGSVSIFEVLLSKPERVQIRPDTTIRETSIA